MMNQKKSSIISFIKIAVIVLFAAFVISRIRLLVIGPPLSIITPENGGTILPGITTLRGNARTATNVWISGIPVPIDTKGIFAYDIYVPPGLSKIPIKAQNTYGKTRTIELIVWGEELKKQEE